MTENQQFLLYTAPDGAVKVDVYFKDETAWLTQKALAELFGVKRPAITKHLLNIFATGELAENSVCSVLEHTARDGKTYSAKFYNLDAIIAVGYRVNSCQATRFRIWASERRFYQKITDIYALAADYDPQAPITKEFFATVQNKLHWAITGQTAAELIHSSAAAMSVNMGLATWKRAPNGKVLKSDVGVAKNYMNEAHVKELNRIVSAYLDLAEYRAARSVFTRMAEWEYEVFRKRQDQDYISDFDREIKRLKGKE